MYSPYIPIFTSQQARSVPSGYRHEQHLYGENVNLMSRAGSRPQQLMKQSYHAAHNSSLPPIPPNVHCGANNNLIYDFGAAAAAAAAAASANMNDMQYGNLNIDRGVKRRRRLTQEETSLLNDIFERTSKPNALVRKMLAERLNMSPRTVQIWFQNRRAKVKKDGKSTSSPNVSESSASTNGDSPSVKSLSETGLSRSVSATSNTTESAYKLISQEQDAFTPSLASDNSSSNISDWSADCDWAFQPMSYNAAGNSMYLPNSKESPANPNMTSDDAESDSTATTASSTQPWQLQIPLGSCDNENYLGIHHLKSTQEGDASTTTTTVTTSNTLSLTNGAPADWFADCTDSNYILGTSYFPIADYQNSL
ncbi:hypothetical protein INT43_001756 [Umbelopsis isabellina]|uniref:Homeobox domain-containing protein n=1 Tax=Mortierella isabellina TaxID=91625 RepID=A0A8H7PSV1_MORIS|nr:hypothetical protein INT43_001756 [Umbelopsis isabellina]